MNKRVTILFVVSVVLKTVVSTIITAKYSTASAAELHHGIYYKRVGSSYFGRGRRISQLQCAKECMNEDNCKSVHVDGEACVFGVDDVTVFEEGEAVTPDPSQVLRVKGSLVI